LALFGLAALLPAQCPGVPYNEGFDGLTGSATGTGLAGQGGFFIPTVGGADALVHTYAGNTVTTNNGPVTVGPNPRGGTQFVSETSVVTNPGTATVTQTFSRAQRDLTFDQCTRWAIATDIYVTPNPIDTNNIASISTQAPNANQALVVKQVILLATWVAGSAGTQWNAGIVYADAVPATPTTAVTALVPNAGFQNLAVNTWYRWECVFDLTTNEIVEISITNLATNVAAVHRNTAMYLLGGPASPHAIPQGFRLFGGTSASTTVVTQGNTVCWDNVSVHPWLPSGAGCTGTAGEPYLTTLNGAIAGGSPFTIVVSNVPATSPFVMLVLGSTNTTTPFGFSPFDLAPLGIVGLGPTVCNIYISADIGLVFPGAAAGVASFSLPIPAVFAGFSVFGQAGVPDFGLNSANLSVSNAGGAVIK
jgi:hypothetical protein